MIRRLIAGSRQNAQFHSAAKFHSSIQVADDLPASASPNLIGTKKSDKWVKSWKSQVKSGQYTGSFEAWKKEKFKPKTPVLKFPPISTLRPSEASGAQEHVTPLRVPSRKCARILRNVSINGQNVGKVDLWLNDASVPPNALLRMYYDSDKGLLRFKTEDGSSLPESTDIDLLSKAGWPTMQPLLLLAKAEGLIDKIPPSHIESFDFKANLDSGFYVRARQKSGTEERRAYLPLPGCSPSPRFRFIPVDLGKGSVRIFPYIDENHGLRLWDVDEKRDLTVMGAGRKPQEGWTALEIKKRSPKLFELAKNLGYWKDVS